MTTQEKISDLTLKLKQLDSVKVLQIPFEVVRPIIQTIRNYGTVVYRDTNLDLSEDIFEGEIFETIGQQQIFDENSEQGILIEALAKVAVNYYYIQITNT